MARCPKCRYVCRDNETYDESAIGDYFGDGCPRCGHGRETGQEDCDGLDRCVWCGEVIDEHSPSAHKYPDMHEKCVLESEIDKADALADERKHHG